MRDWKCPILSHKSPRDRNDLEEFEMRTPIAHALCITTRREDDRHEIETEKDNQ